MHCRRCLSHRLLQLDKKLPSDHNVFRCQECGFLFSPGDTPAPASDPSAQQGELSRTVAVESSYHSRR